jgi:hypothetical protein
MIGLAVQAIRPTEEYWHWAEGGSVDVHAGKERLSCVRTTAHKQTHNRFSFSPAERPGGNLGVRRKHKITMTIPRL